MNRAVFIPAAALALSALAWAVAPSTVGATSCAITPAYAVWPQDSATDVPIQTHVWVATDSDFGGHDDVVLRETDTDLIVPVTRTKSSGDITVWEPDAPLQPNTTYTVTVGQGSDQEAPQPTEFTTRADDTTPAPPEVLSVRSYLHTHKEVESAVSWRCTLSPFTYNTTRHVHTSVQIPSLDDTHPRILSVGANTHMLHRDSPYTVVTTTNTNEDDPSDHPCLTVVAFDPFGQASASETICAPDACLHSAALPADVSESDFTAEACDFDTDALPSRSTPSANDDSAGCAVTPREPTCTTPLVALLLALVLGARRRRAQRPTEDQRP